MTPLNTFIKKTKEFQKHQGILEPKKETVMLQVIKILNKKADFLDMTSLSFILT